MINYLRNWFKSSKTSENSSPSMQTKKDPKVVQNDTDAYQELVDESEKKIKNRKKIAKEVTIFAIIPCTLLATAPATVHIAAIVGGTAVVAAYLISTWGMLWLSKRRHHELLQVLNPRGVEKSDLFSKIAHKPETL